MRKYILLLVASVWLLQSCNEHVATTTETTNTIQLSSATNNATCVYLTTDEKNNPVISWCETDSTGKKYFFFCFFDTSSSKFLSPINIPIDQRAALHEEGMPKIAVKGDGSIVAVYEVEASTKENEWAGFIAFIQTSDKGKTWTAPRCIHADTAANGSHSFASITRLSNGEIGACWLDASTNKSGRPVKFASANGNNGFTNEVLVDSIACECCRTAISCNANKISIVYRDIINDSIRDMSVSTSSDNGKTFSNPVSFSKDDWNIMACPHNGPGVVTTANATYATWFTGASQKGVYYGELNNTNQTVVKKQLSSNGRNIQLCLTADNSRLIAYNEMIQEGDSVYYKIVLDRIDGDKIFTKDATASNIHASYPVIKSFANNKTVVAWKNNQKIYYTIINADEIKKPL
ncbi:exo-alpha-sialidase [Ferruginibacter albus]|uniref:exo-alpha-sialidase n=1 Tax=Ferruginibacter albus TaxID=2875540 RepID=UPI001CC69BA7|nr:exo-alpha-sialidase [Ferruginibacter albus]UAY52717.1 exo-alpha-sialidase [Ferruginibacter albus]